MVSTMFAIGWIEEFDESKEDIEVYLQRLEHWMAANRITAPPADQAEAIESRVSVILTVIGASMYGVLRNLLTPAAPNTKTYTELVQTLKAHFKPQSLVIAERFRCYRRDQQTGETIAAYVMALKHQARRCKFGAFLEESLRDRLVCGLRSNTIQKKLLTEKDLTFKRACDLAQAMELAARDTAELAIHAQPRESTVHLVSTATKKEFRKPTMDKGEQCYRCGGKHDAQKCWHNKSKCHRCTKGGPPQTHVQEQEQDTVGDQVGRL